MCIDCGEPLENPCSCDDGKHAWGVTSTSTSVTGTSFTMTMSTLGQYSGGWAAVNEHVFIQGYGYYKVTASTASTISVTEPASPYVGGAAFVVNTVDFQAHGTSGNYTIPSGTKVTPAGLKGTTGATGGAGASLIAIDHNQLGSNNPTSQTSYSAVQETVTVAAASTPLNAVGDSLRIKARFFYNDTTGYAGVGAVQGKVVFQQTSTGVTIAMATYNYDAKFPGGEFDIVLSRSAVAGDIDYIVTHTQFDAFAFDYTNETAIGNTLVRTAAIEQGGGLINFAADFSIEFWGKVNNGSDAIKIGFYSIEFLNKA